MSVVKIRIRVRGSDGECPIEADNSNVEVESDTKTGIHGDLIVESVEMEFTAWK